MHFAMKELLIETKRVAYNYETLLEPNSSARVRRGAGGQLGVGVGFLSFPSQTQ